MKKEPQNRGAGGVIVIFVDLPSLVTRSLV